MGGARSTSTDPAVSGRASPAGVCYRDQKPVEVEPAIEEAGVSGLHRDDSIEIRGAREHNLQDLDLAIPRRRLTVVTGVSGSGKSSLAFDTLFREGQRRFLELMPSFARRFAGGFRRPEVRSMDGLGPAIAVGQGTRQTNPRSTVGTLTEVWDLLRLLFARMGHAPEGVTPSRGLFSFNGDGACPSCQGLGVEDTLDPDLLVADPARSLREGALRVSTPNGYLMYSQVTLAVLDEVLRLHGGSVDVPWRDLTDEVRDVVLRGSDRLLVPYGKHPLENRLKWTGITARPRQEGHYRGLLPVMEEILRGKRNESILRFVRTADCRACGGTRLKPEARSVRWRDRGIAEVAALTARELASFLESEVDEHPIFSPIRADLLARCRLMEELGLGYLAFDRGAPSLSLGESQRLRLLSLALGELRGVLIVLDEPSAGLHPREIERLLGVLRRLRDRGQTVVVVDHDPRLALAADWLVDLGPGPGKEGGRLLWTGPPRDLVADGGPDTPTRRWLRRMLEPAPVRRADPASQADRIVLRELSRHNVTSAVLEITPGALHVITGVSGAGKTSLLDAAVERFRFEGTFRRIVTVDADPIGRTPRSNPATYTGAFDSLRDLFAATEEAKARGLGKGHFTFNTAGGRCEACEGAGVIEVGMRYLGRVDLLCEACGGRRFHPEVLAVKRDGVSIADVLEGSILDAAGRFRAPARLARILDALVQLGLGYLPLGQPATTLSSGEAQRVKLATELARAARPALIALDEPSTGLHADDVAVLLRAFRGLCQAGHTLLVVDNDLDVVRAADRVTELGPGGGPEGGQVIAAGDPREVADTGSLIAVDAVASAERAVDASGDPGSDAGDDPGSDAGDDAIELLGVTTNNLRSVDVRIPARGLTVVTGPSGSGKSSLVLDTLLAESQARFADLVSPWARRFLPMKGGAELTSARGVRAAIAVPAEAGRRNPRATVGTLTEIDELLRLLFARAGTRPCPECGRAFEGRECACGRAWEPLWAGDFSPHGERGACPDCRGLGFHQACDPDRLVTSPHLPLDGGAIDSTRFGAYLAEPDGQHMATLRAAGRALGLDLSGPYRDLPPAARRLALEGAGDRTFEVAWEYRRGRRSGVHRFTAPWAGLLALVEKEFERVHADPSGEELESLLVNRPCATCQGERLKATARAVTLAGLRAPEAAARQIDSLSDWTESFDQNLSSRMLELARPVRADLQRRLQALCEAGLGYLAPARELSSLSGGEFQRTRLAAALSGGMAGITYVLDEPTQGLHPRDTRRLVGVLRSLAEAGNAVVVVEHDPAIVAAADHLLELGPGAGPDGGLLVAAGSPASLREDPSTYTSRLLRDRHPSAPRIPRPFAPGVSVRGAHRRNLREIDVTLPIGAVTAIAGVSGSGKSTLLREVLAPSLRAAFRGRAAIGCTAIALHAPLSAVLEVEQDGLAMGGASTVATLLDLSDTIHRRFAATPEARQRGLTARAFSTGTPGGRCEACEGRGFVTVAMDLLPDVRVGCEICGGRRFSDEVLACRVQGHTIQDMLEATLPEALVWLDPRGIAADRIHAMVEIGLGYLRLGQAGAALSSGERQRLRLARLLAEPRPDPLAILLDEPTRGLGIEDVDRLARSLHAAADAGHLVVVVEHEPRLLAGADWVIELGPEGGAGGGRVLRAGPP